MQLRDDIGKRKMAAYKPPILSTNSRQASHDAKPILGRIFWIVARHGCLGTFCPDSVALGNVVEEWKWMGTPVWSHDGIICTGESYKSVVKLTFAKGASLKDPARLFNSSLDGNVRRALDIHEREEVDESAFKALVRQAVALNSSGQSKPSKKAKP
jgi:hypothetical protein